MRYKLLGNSGLRVSELALGTMTFGEQNADGVATKSVSRKLFDAFIEAGRILSKVQQEKLRAREREAEFES